MGEAKSDILQGTLDLMVLKTLDAMGPMHGYGIARRIEQISEETLQINQGTIYLCLIRLVQKGWIDCRGARRRTIARRSSTPSPRPARSSLPGEPKLGARVRRHRSAAHVVAEVVMGRPPAVRRPSPRACSAGPRRIAISRGDRRRISRWPPKTTSAAAWLPKRRRTGAHRGRGGELAAVAAIVTPAGSGCSSDFVQDLALRRAVDDQGSLVVGGGDPRDCPRHRRQHVGFSIINAAFIRGFNFERADELHSISWRPTRGRRLPSSVLDLEDWRSQSRSFAAIGASSSGAINISDDHAAPEQTQGARVTANFRRPGPAAAARTHVHRQARIGAGRARRHHRL